MKTGFSRQPRTVKPAPLWCEGRAPEASLLDALDSLSSGNGDENLRDTALYITQVVGFKHVISVYLNMMYLKNLCNQCFSEELPVFSCDEDKPMLMLFKMDENVTKDCL